MGDEADADWQAGLIDAGRELVEQSILGPRHKPRQTALRLRGRSVETVEIGDDGKIIEPLRCTCGTYLCMHAPSCPFYCAMT